MKKNFSNENTSSNKKKFIRDNFDLLVLKKAGFIDSLTNFEMIEERINKLAIMAGLTNEELAEVL